MLLTRLKYWRELRGYSLRELADKSKVPYSAISLLENGKREPQGRTSRKLAAALEVELAELYSLPLTQEPTQSVSDNKTITIIKSARAKTKKQPTISFWIIEKDQEEGDPFRTDSQDEAERLKKRLGKARVYQAASKFEAWELHRAFLIRVVRGHDTW